MNKKKLLVFFGMTAAGKSYLAGKWSKKKGCPYYNTDVVRKELAGVQEKSGANEEIGKGIYSENFTRKTYDALMQRALDAFLSAAENFVVLDGSYAHEDERHNVIRVCGDVAEIFFIYCYCDENLVKTRLKQRAADPDAVSDGRWEVFLMQKKKFMLPESINGAALLVLNTDDRVERLIDSIDRFID